MSLSSQSLDAVLEEAAKWHARMECGTADVDAFEAWRSADPRHAAAFARMVGAAAQVTRLKPALRQTRISVSRRDWMRGAVAASAAAALGGGAYLISGSGRVSAKTPVGGEASRLLDDGSRLHINTDTTVQWRVDSRRREVWLENGEVALTVSSGETPMVFHGAGRTIEIRQGTFNARIRNGALDLLVLKGRAEVRARTTGLGQRASAVAVGEGNAILVGAEQSRVRPVTSDEVQFVSAWQKGEVVFNGETLGAAIDEYNRYLVHKITIGDPALQGIRLGGRFSSREPKVFLASLHSAFAITATATSDGSIVLTR